MIYLIGGPPRCGKTSAAKLLAKKTHISFLPADYIVSAVMQYVPKKDFRKKFPLTHLRRTMKGGNDALYARYNPKEIIRMYETGARSVQLALKIIVEYAAMEKQDYILEGYEITPALAHSLLNGKFRKHIKSLFLYKHDPEKILKHITEKEPEHDWIALNTKNSKTLVQIADMLSQYGKHVEKEAKKYHLTSINTDTNFAAQIKKAVSQLIKQPSTRF